MFWDTSALVKAYSTETGTPTVQAALRALPRRTSVTAYVALETLSVLTKLLRTRNLSSREYRRARNQFYADYPGRFVHISVKPQIRQHALALAESHRRAGVGALDILHLACALHVQAAIHPRTGGARRG